MATTVYEREICAGYRKFPLNDVEQLFTISNPHPFAQFFPYVFTFARVYNIMKILRVELQVLFTTLFPHTLTGPECVLPFAKTDIVHTHFI